MNWFYLCLTSPYAGLYHWRNGDREDELELRLIESDDLKEVKINVMGDEEELERMWKTLNFFGKRNDQGRERAGHQR